jgi:hypothetical protein
MPLTGCTIQTIYSYDNPNEGRVKINQNFECLTNNLVPGSGSTSNSGNRWYIPSGETVNIDSTYQGFIYGDLVIDGTINVDIDSQLVVVNGDIILTGGTITGAGTVYTVDTPNTYVIGGTYSSGTTSFFNNSGGTFDVTGYTYVTGGTYSAGTITFSDNTGGTFDVTGLSTGSTLFFNTFSNFPSGGTNDAIYVDDTNNVGYLWNSTLSAYTNIAGTQNLDEIPLTFAQAATVSALGGNPFYTNGLSGVGATLTATTVGVLTDNTGIGRIDYNYIPQVGDVLLVKNQTPALRNGLYTIDDVGSLSTGYKLTRVSDFDESSELFPLQVNVLGGSNNALKYFIQSTVNPVIGTSGLVFSISSQQTVTYQTAFVDTATSAPLPSCTYISGTTYTTLPGVGAVLSATTNGALGFINGLSATTNPNIVNGFTKVLVKDQVNPAHNGDYSVTNAGSPTTKWVLKRINDWGGAYSRYTRYFLVSNNGSTKAGKYYFTTPNNPPLANSGVNGIGVAPINIVEYGGASGGTSSLLWFAEPSYAPTTPPSVLGTDSIAIGNNSQAPSAYAFSVGTNAGYQSSGSTYSNFIGLSAGYQTTGATNSNFFGYGAGYQAPNSSNSNFFGNGAGQQATGASNSNFFGPGAGVQATGSVGSNFFGVNAGYQATGASGSNFFGSSAGQEAAIATDSNFIGYNAGYQAVGSNNSNFFGRLAGYQARTATNSNFIGQSAGQQATGSSYSNFLGQGAGTQATGSTYSNFFGVNAGYLAKDVSYSNFLGNQAGYQATNVSNSNFLGFNSGNQATGSTFSNFFGYQAGQQATGASYSNFLGNSAGQLAIDSSNSNFIGYQAGTQATGSSYSNFLGTNAGYQSPSSIFSNFFGYAAGQQATNVSYSNFLGQGAGQSATGSTGSNFLGYLAGQSATGSSYSNFFGYNAGQLAIGASYSNFLGNSAGYQARTVTNSNFFGLNSGYQATGASNSNFFGSQAGYQAIGSSSSNFLGNSSGYLAATVTHSNFIGQNAGYQATGSTFSNFLGLQSGYQATGSSNSNFFGYRSGYQVIGSTSSNFLGSQSGYQAIGSSHSNFFGASAGYQATGATNSNFLGNGSGYQATGSSQSNFIGNQAGYQAKNSTDSNFLGYAAGFQATNSNNSNFLGQNVGFQATGSTYSNFLGTNAGYQATGSSYSNFFGYNAGRSFAGNSLGSNNIIIGTNISLSGGTTDSMNIGGVLFGSGLYSSIAGNPSITPTASGRIGIGVVNPRERLHVLGNTFMDGSLTATTATISGTGQNILTVIGSGNTSPLFSVQGSYGELFSITDSLSGSLFSVNDISGLPILEVFDDNTTLMGSFLAPSLNTTVKITAGIGDTNIYSIITSAYTGAFFEYTASNSEGIRAGSIMSVWSGTSITYTETPTSSIGETTGITFNMILGTTATLRASGTTAGWTVKTIVRSI